MKDGWNTGVIKKDNQVAGFVGSSVKSRLIDGTVLVYCPWAADRCSLYPIIPYSAVFGKRASLSSIGVYLAGQ